MTPITPEDLSRGSKVGVVHEDPQQTNRHPPRSFPFSTDAFLSKRTADGDQGHINLDKIRKNNWEHGLDGLSVNNEMKRRLLAVLRERPPGAHPRMHTPHLGRPASPETLGSLALQESQPGSLHLHPSANQVEHPRGYHSALEHIRRMCTPDLTDRLLWALG